MESENNHYKNNAMTDLVYALLQNDIESGEGNMETCIIEARGLTIAAQPDLSYVVTYPGGEQTKMDLRSVIDALRLR